MTGLVGEEVEIGFETGVLFGASGLDGGDGKGLVGHGGSLGSGFWGVIGLGGWNVGLRVFREVVVVGAVRAFRDPGDVGVGSVCFLILFLPCPSVIKLQMVVSIVNAFDDRFKGFLMLFLCRY